MFEEEFEAVILAAGRGSRLGDLFNRTDALNSTPKCLLPVGPYPLIWYPLNLLQRHNFEEVTIIVLENEKTKISEALAPTKLKIKIIYKSIPGDADFGTADSLRHIYAGRRIKSDIIVLSCDLITNASLYPLINKFRTHDASLAVLLFKNDLESGVKLPGVKGKQIPERDLISIQPESNRVLMLTSLNDFEDSVPLNAHLLSRNRKMHIFTKLLDGHCYILKKWVLQYLNGQSQISTLKGEFVPLIIKKQMSKDHLKLDSPMSDVDGVASSKNTDKCDLPYLIKQTALERKIRQTSFYNDSLSAPSYCGDALLCYAVQEPKEVIGIRVNTALSFYAINQKLTSLWPLLVGDQQIPAVSPSAIVASTQIENIFAGSKAKLSEKTSLKGSVFAPNCVVEPKCIISNSIILANAVIEGGCKIENCIIGEYARIEQGCEVKNCLVGPQFVMEQGTKAQGAHLSKDDFIEDYLEI